MNTSTCGCSGKRLENKAATGTATNPVIRTLGTGLGWGDMLGGWRARWGIDRMHYSIEPGLYQVGQPNADSDVLVTANYKLTVDTLRRSLVGLDVWLLVIDTKGVNVWCAAGKGTFGTEEVVRSINATQLSSVVRHHDLVLPQLAATGVAAHEVKRATGFSVNYGPVRAGDIRAYLAAGKRATPAMRQVKFGWRDRLVVAPMELVGARKPALFILAALVLLNLSAHKGLAHVGTDFIPFACAILTGGLAVPLLLPWLPFRAFALKGAVIGVALAGTLVWVLGLRGLDAAGTGLLVTAITSHMAMVFTGATTFTTQTGARLEVRWGLPLILVAAGVGTALRIMSEFA